MKLLASSLAALVILAFPFIARAQGPTRERPTPTVVRGERGAALTLPSTASAQAIVAAYLRGQGRDAATAQSLAVVSETPAAAGLRHARFEQRVAGLPVFGTYAKATLNARGELVHLIENLAPVRGGLRAAQVSARAAIDAALAHLYPGVRNAPAGFFHRDPSAARVAVPEANGSMSEGYLVETWSEERNQLHYTLVSGTGAILDVESRTNTDSYNVFRVHPAVSPQEVVSGPGSTNESPAGWLGTGAQSTTLISGNNARAYLDVVSDNAPDTGGEAVADGNFLTAADLSAQPGVQTNRAVAVQNLFYLNNLTHDVLYRHGFTESAGNFQADNFNRGGLSGDPVNAEAQDGGGTDNANFATPVDGSSPRMQMYLWTGLGTHRVVAGGVSYVAQGAAWGGTLTTTGITAPLVVVNDGAGTPSDACEKMPRGSLQGQIAVADRGTCDFTVKATNAQVAGAVAIVIANNVEGAIFTMGGSSGRVNIPGVMVSLADGAAIKAAAGTAGTVKAADVAPLSLDGDLDSDIVYHEYGHGLTWRMIGGMNGPLAGAIGEGMSDVLAIVINDDDRVGEYSASDPVGIRRNPYTNYPRTYADVAGSSVHNDGEIYAAAIWHLWKSFQANGLSRDLLLDYLVQGMNYTPSTPDYEAMRDGILTAVQNHPSGSLAHGCLVWDAFAQFGIGVGADGVARGKRVTITESFAVPAQCQ